MTEMQSDGRQKANILVCHKGLSYRFSNEFIIPVEKLHIQRDLFTAPHVYLGRIFIIGLVTKISLFTA